MQYHELMKARLDLLRDNSERCKQAADDLDDAAHNAKSSVLSRLESADWQGVTPDAAVEAIGREVERIEDTKGKMTLVSQQLGRAYSSLKPLQSRLSEIDKEVTDDPHLKADSKGVVSVKADHEGFFNFVADLLILKGECELRATGFNAEVRRILEEATEVTDSTVEKMKAADEDLDRYPRVEDPHSASEGPPEYRPL